MKLAKFNALGNPKAMLLADQKINAIEDYQLAMLEVIENFPPANFISPFLNQATVEIEDFFYDFLPTQRLWLRQTGRAGTTCIRRKRSKILTDQIRQGGFEAVIFQGTPPPMSQEEWISLRKKNRKLEYVIAHLGHPFKPELLSGVDLILCASDELTKFYRDAGFRSETYYHSFPIHLLSHSKNFDDRNFEFTFVGSSGINLDSHQHRLRYLQNLVKTFECKLFLNNQDNIVLPRSISFSNEGIYEFRVRMSQIKKDIYDKLCFSKSMEMQNKRFDSPVDLFESAEESIYGLEMFKTLGNTKLTVQIHTSATKSAGAMRIFESAGMGVCLVSDGDNMDKILTPGSEVVTFSSEEELHKNCNYLLTHQDEMREIAENAQKAVINRHSNRIRAQEFLEITGLKT